MMVFGSPKQGKSILCVQFAKYLSENFGEVLYVASEEGFSATLQSKVRDFSMANGNLDFANFREYSEIEEAVTNGSYDFLFIDSVNYIRMSPEDVENLKKVNKRMAIITIQQATKDGKYKGDTAYAHNCDIIVKVKEGIAFAQGRFAAPAEMPIFDFEETEGNDDAGAGLGDSDYQTYDDR
jgi:predicted ATP-dependent serine protease